MRIAVLLPSLENRGPIIFSKYLVSCLLEINCEIEVYYFRDSKNQIVFPVSCYKIGFFTIKRFKKFHIIHSTMAIPDLYVFFHRYIIYPKHVISMHNLMAEDLKMLYSPFISWFKIHLWKMAHTSKSTFIYSSNFMKNYYDKFIGEFNSVIIPYGIPVCFDLDADLDDKLLLIKLKSKYKIIGSVGLIIKRKGFIQLIDLLILNKNIAVIIIGDGDLTIELNKLAKDKGVSDRFHILGFKQNSGRYYRYFDIFAMVSYSEGFGMAMIEALGHALPLLCSNLPIYKGIIPSDSVCFFEPGNIEDLNFAFNRLSTNLEKFKSLSVKLYEENFSLSKMALSHFGLYSKLVKK